MGDKVKLRVPVRYDGSYTEKTEIGILRGEEVVKTIKISVDEAQKLIQDHIISEMDYEKAQEFVKKYSK